MCVGKAISSPSGIRMSDFLWFRGDLGPGHALNHAQAGRTCVYLYAIINIFPLSSGHVWLELIYNSKLHQTVSMHIQVHHVQLCMAESISAMFLIGGFLIFLFFYFKILNTCIRHVNRNMYTNSIGSLLHRSWIISNVFKYFHFVSWGHSKPFHFCR